MHNGGLVATAGESFGAVAAATGTESAVAFDQLPYSAVRDLAPKYAPVASPSTAAPHSVGRYQLVLLLGDIAAALVAVATAFFTCFASRFGTVSTVDRLFAVALPLCWVAAVALSRGYERRFVGVGSAEFDRVFRASLSMTSVIVFVSFMTQWDITRRFLVLAVIFTLGGDLVVRYIARKWLHAARSRGQYLTSVLAIGGAQTVAEFADRVQRDRQAGMQVVGACLVRRPHDAADVERLGQAGVLAYGDVDSVVSAVRASGANRVVVLAGEVSPQKLRWISWQLEGDDVDLIVSPGLVEIGGRRLHIQPVAGLPLLHIDQPEFTGFRRVLKGCFDRTLALMALLFISPLLLAIAAAVRLTSSGPALFRQVRVGANGTTFMVYKFRSMVVDAEQRLADLQEHNENSDGLLFKMKRDPRVTRVGAFLRKYSLDELPQLLNVVRGDMSLVGPRPPLPAEVAQYESDVRRRLLVKPGITGLWQVSGRSDLSWEESVRLDLHYVENWSLATDMLILWKTAFAVACSAGAY